MEVSHPRGQDVALERRGEQGHALQLFKHIEHAVEPAFGPLNPSPSAQKLREPCGRHGLDGLAQAGERATFDLTEHVAVDPFAMRRTRREFALNQQALAGQRLEPRADGLGIDPVARHQTRHAEADMRPRIAQDYPVQRIRDRIEQRMRESDRQHTPRGIAIARGLLARDPARCARKSDWHNASNPLQFGKGVLQFRFREFFTVNAQLEFCGRQIAESKQQIVDIVGMPDTWELQSRKRFGDLVNGLGLEQRAIVRRANQLFELAVVER